MKKTIIGLAVTVIALLLFLINGKKYPEGINYISSSNDDVFINKKANGEFAFHDLENGIVIEGKEVLKGDSVPNGHIHIAFDDTPGIIPQELSLQNLSGTSKFKCLKCGPSMKDWVVKKS
ncbi:hypothetical protein [Vibrio parahaemolyticus]|uniref:hypothetical protein n=1 Tax=Vibrio parahaemolyticus TaxID=670 RepID=UPI001121409F|nr:hypothetical protein [Vibrio parahaemolyticus]MCQ9100210.1 hypothetical protein [Vibrio parahaemolyticus]MDL2009759.1 hypothetical protein [Vibrio parahaemolyticus]TON79341.1 hypothetical protein CGH49_22710 [Vibrio parahaemolyticus]HCG6695578.1 hypothetical protein [Vibrio parahaemolyticus]